VRLSPGVRSGQAVRGESCVHKYLKLVEKINFLWRRHFRAIATEAQVKAAETRILSLPDHLNEILNLLPLLTVCLPVDALSSGEY
jgi:hypothetical protein